MNSQKIIYDRRQMRELLSPAEAAVYLNVETHTVTRLCRNGEIQATKIGRLWRIPRDPLAAMFGIETKR